MSYQKSYHMSCYIISYISNHISYNLILFHLSHHLKLTEWVCILKLIRWKLVFCRACLKAMDPYCGWDGTLKKCIPFKDRWEFFFNLPIRYYIADSKVSLHTPYPGEVTTIFVNSKFHFKIRMCDSTEFSEDRFQKALKIVQSVWI